MQTSRGMRNCNPLNIRRSKDRWQGAATEQKDGQFVTFKSYAYGYRAAWRILQSYFNRFRECRMSFCLRNIIHRWAPPEDGNDTEAYVRAVIGQTLMAANEPLPEPSTFEGRQRLTPVIVAMTCVENGIKPGKVPQDAIGEGHRLAFR